MGFETPNLEDREARDEARRQQMHPEAGLRDARAVNQAPTEYREKTDDEENDEFVTANDPEKFVPVEDIGEEEELMEL